MSFLAPLFFVALAGLAIPVLVHLIQREKKRVVQFPSLMFLQRIPYKSVRRRRIHNWTLLILRLAAFTLIVMAFARPFVRRAGLPAAGQGGAREVVLLVDRSYSMGYGDRWQRARRAARDEVGRLGPADRASIVLFDSGAEVAVRSTSEQGRLLAAIDSAQPGAGSTRYAPALKLAGSILAESRQPRREALLISDFQRSGWTGATDVRLPDGATLATVAVGGEETANVAVTPVALTRSTFSNQERVTVTAGALNRSARDVGSVTVTLEVDGRPVQTRQIALAANGAASTTFDPLTLTSPNVRGSVRLAADALAADNAFHFVLSPTEPVRVALVDGGRRDASLYLTRALEIGESPRFHVTMDSPELAGLKPALRHAQGATGARGQGSGVRGQEFAEVVILNDVAIAAGAAGRLAKFVNAGGGLFVVLGSRGAWPSTSLGRGAAGAADVLPGSLGPIVDRSKGEAGRLGGLEYGHPVFELFRAPRSGDFTTARVYGYRSVAVTSSPASQDAVAAGKDEAAAGKLKALPLQPQTRAVPLEPRTARQPPSVTVLARFDDGAPALVERRVGEGRVLLWTTTLDLFWNDLPLKPVFLPFVHRIVRYLASYAEPSAWMTVGQVLDPGASGVVLTPSGRRVTIDAEGPQVLELTEPGFYEARAESGPTVVATNVDLSESDLTAIDPAELVASVAGRPETTSAGGPAEMPRDEEQERAQRLWWYGMFAALVLLGAESVLANRLSGRRG